MTTKLYILMNADDRHYYDDYTMQWTFTDLASSSPIVWELTESQVREYQQMFYEHAKYQNFHFVQIIAPTPASKAMIDHDLAQWQAKKAEEKRKREEADRKRKEAAAAKKLEKEAKKLAQNEELRLAMYKQLKQEFESNGRRWFVGKREL